MKTPAIPTKAYLALLVVYIVWGTTLGAMRIGVDSFPVFLLPCLRFLLAGILLTAFCLLRGERLPSRADLLTHGIIGTLLFVGGNSIVCWSIQFIDTGLSGLMVATTPFWMVGFSALMPPREKPAPIAMVGIFIGFVGMLILLSPQLTHPGETSPIFWLAVGAMLVNVFCWSLGSIWARKKHTANSLLMSVGLQNLIAGLLLIPVALLTISDWSAVRPTMASWTALAYLVLFGTVLATPCYLYVLQTLPVAVSSTFAYVTPVLTVIFGWLFLGETLTSTTVFGSMVILSGVVVVQWVTQARSARAALKTSPSHDLKGVSAS